jgi:hypothetical protein
MLRYRNSIPALEADHFTLLPCLPPSDLQRCPQAAAPPRASGSRCCLALYSCRSLCELPAAPTFEAREATPATTLADAVGAPPLTG